MISPFPARRRQPRTAEEKQGSEPTESRKERASWVGPSVLVAAPFLLFALLVLLDRLIR